MREVSDGWLETFFFVTEEITLQRGPANPAKWVEEINKQEGSYGFVDLALRLTDKFQEKFENHDWSNTEKEYWEEIEQFLMDEL